MSQLERKTRGDGFHVVRWRDEEDQYWVAIRASWGREQREEWQVIGELDYYTLDDFVLLVGEQAFEVWRWDE